MLNPASPHTRAFLFADLRGYTAYVERHGDSAGRELLRTYRAAVREVIGTFGGAEIRTEGDSFYVVFGSVAEAVRAGLAILAAVEPPIQVGIGIHAGESEDSDEGIVSGAVNLAARVCAAAAPGELLVTDTVRALTRTYLDVRFVARGRRRFKGIGEPMALYQVVAAGDVLPRARRRPSLRIAAVVIGLAVLALGAVIIGPAVLRDRGGLADSSPAGIGSSQAAASAPQSSASAVAGLDAPYPNPEEQGLLLLVEESDRPGCERGLRRDAPGIWFRDSAGGATGPWVNEPVPYQGGITCPVGGSVGPDTVWYWHVQPATQRGLSVEPVELVRNHAGRLAVFPGGDGCDASPRALEDWSFGDTAGLLLCYTSSDGEAVLEWGYDDADVLGQGRARRWRLSGSARLVDGERSVRPVSCEPSEAKASLATQAVDNQAHDVRRQLLCPRALFGPDADGSLQDERRQPVDR